jgi:pimeloyl-ACP methyl ester carboxylesterase
VSSRSRTEPGARAIVTANGVALCVQDFGDPADPAILLIHGAATSMGGWNDRFCARLASSGRFVIRYDHRDTGESVSYPTGAPGYGLHDLIDDAIGILDVYGIARAHWVGTSMGGGIAIGAALEHPARVASLTLIGTSPGGAGLPEMSREFLAHISGPGPDFRNRAAVLDHFVALLRIFAAGSAEFDAAEPALREGLNAEFDRTTNLASSQVNHFVMETGAPIRARLAGITAPTLVIHGEKDPIFPLGHGRALADEIPGATLLVLKNTAHAFPESSWDEVVPAIVKLSARANGPERRPAGP